MKHPNWRLPDGVDELLPPAAWALEQVRRTVLDVFHSWGFDYVEPPLIEYLDALLVGSGSDRTWRVRCWSDIRCVEPMSIH